MLRSLLVLLVAAGLAGPKATGPEQQQLADVQWQRTEPKVSAPAVEIAAPIRVRTGEKFSLKALLRSRGDGKAAVELFRDGQSLRKETLAAGENRAVFSDIVLKPKRSWAVYSLRVADDRGAWPEDNGSACVVQVDPPPRVLLVESQQAPAEHLRRALADENLAVEVKAELPAGPLTPYDLIILSNVPATALPEPRMKALQTYVRDDRGGLIAIGGNHAFAAGQYLHTPLEEMLPVISEERTNKPKQTLAMVLVLDISGSMNEPSANKKLRNIDLAKQALRTAVKMLRPRNQVGVMVFEDSSRWIWPLAPVGDEGNKSKILAEIDKIKAEGSTNMYPPLEKAYLALRETFADLKHIIVTTDGLGEPGDFDALAQKMAEAGIKMTTVGVGSEPARPFLQSIAEKAKGRAYFCPDAEKVPGFFETEIGVVAKIGITEGNFFPKATSAAEAIQGLDMSQAPVLLGYAEAKAQAGGPHGLGQQDRRADPGPLAIRRRHDGGLHLRYRRPLDRTLAELAGLRQVLGAARAADDAARPAGHLAADRRRGGRPLALHARRPGPRGAFHQRRPGQHAGQPRSPSSSGRGPGRGQDSPAPSRRGPAWGKRSPSPSGRGLGRGERLLHLGPPGSNRARPLRRIVPGGAGNLLAGRPGPPQRAVDR